MDLLGARLQPLSSPDSAFPRKDMEEEKMSSELLIVQSQESVTLEDAFVDFTWEKRSELDPVQTDVNRDMMLENYENLVFLGPRFSVAIAEDMKPFSPLSTEWAI